MRLTCFFEFGSPYTYLAWHRMQGPLYADTRWVPFSLWHVVQREGGKLNRDLPNLARYNFQDLRRFAKAYQAPFWFPDSFPARTLDAHRAHVVAEDQGLAAPWREAVFLAHWKENEDISDRGVLARLADQVGLEGLPERLDEAAVKKRLVDATGEAYAAGACGSPFFVLEPDDGKPEAYWGNDRLDWVEARLRGEQAPAHWAERPA